MDKETLVTKAHALESRIDLLNLLNEIKADLTGNKAYPFTLKQLLILCNPKNEINRYRPFGIPKKSGGIRLISSPCGNLKWFQLCLNVIFKALYTPSPYAMGFAAKRSVADNARRHTNQNYVFNIDLQDFFPSIDQARVWKRLQLAPFNFNAKVAGVIAGLCSIRTVEQLEPDNLKERYVLPQGAPTSPLLTNAICDTLDRRLHGLAKRFGLHYSRYADDITFSSMHNVYQPESEFRKELNRIITDQHFVINDKKTRLSHCSARQEVTGLMVGVKINVGRKYVKDLRAIIHIWEKYGLNAAFAAFYPRYKSEKCQLHRGVPNLINIINGRLSYLKMIKGENDPVYIRLNSRFRQLTANGLRNDKPDNIEYLFTLPKTEFEQKLGVTVKFSYRKYDQRPYGYFYYQDRYFVVAVSKNLDIDNLPENVQISLTRMLKTVDFYIDPVDPNCPPRLLMGYLLHKPLRKYKTALHESEDSFDLSELEDFIMSLPSSSPLNVNGTTEPIDNKSILARLVESDFDLSLLP